MFVFVFVVSNSNNVFAKCGNIKIAEMNWASAELIANIDKIILEEKFGCSVELIAGATMPTFNSMANQKGPDIAPEMWVGAVIKPFSKAVHDNKIFIANDAPIPKLGEFWFVSPNVLESNPEIKTIKDIIDRPDLFPHSKYKSKGAFIGCPKGWGCHNVNENLFRAFQMDKKGWILVNPSSAAELDDTIARTIERGQNWFGYYWAPTSMVGKYNLKSLDFGVPYAGNMNWDRCIVKPKKNCQNPQKTSWVKHEVFTITSRKISKKTDISNYLANRKIPLSVMNQMLVIMAEQRASGKEAAKIFFNKFNTIKLSWFNKDIKNKYVYSKPKSNKNDIPNLKASSSELEKEKSKRIALQRKADEEERKRKALEQRIAELEKKNKELQQPKKQQKAKPKSGSGSGFFISKLGHIITNQHVVNKCNKITIGDHIDKQVPAQLLETDRENDLALLRTTNIKMASAETQSLIRKLSIEIVPLASGGLMRKSDVKGGEDVIVAGFPYGVMFSKTIKVTKGIVSSTRGVGDDSGQFQIDAAVQPGNSGGPIYDRYGNIVGVVVAQLNKFKMAKSIGSLPENVNFGIKASTVSQFLNTSGVITNWAKRTKPVSNEKLFDIASKQTVMVVCHRE